MKTKNVPGCRFLNNFLCLSTISFASNNCFLKTKFFISTSSHNKQNKVYTSHQDSRKSIDYNTYKMCSNVFQCLPVLPSFRYDSSCSAKKYRKDKLIFNWGHTRRTLYTLIFYIQCWTDTHHFTTSLLHLTSLHSFTSLFNTASHSPIEHHSSQHAETT